MRSSLVFIIVTVFFVGVVYSITDVCQATTAELKAAIRIRNTWRAACEDHNWKGATCYNYWAQNDEVMTLENNLQLCRTREFQAKYDLMLGNAIAAGIYSADAEESRDVDDAADAVTSKLAVAAETDNRAHITTAIDGVIKSTIAVLDQQSNDTRTTVATESAANKKAESAANSNIRILENTSTQQVLDKVIAQETETRKFVDDAHTETKKQITESAQADFKSSRENDDEEEASTRATMVEESNNTQTVVKSQASQSRASDLAQERVSRANTVSEHTTSRTTVAAEHDNTRQGVVDAAADKKTTVNDTETANRQVVNDDAASNIAAASASAGSLRGLFSGLQAGLVGAYASEFSTMLNDMWTPFVKILVHYDLQGKSCDKFGDTFTFATLSAAGAGRFEQMRAEALDSMIFNEQMYGTSKVGYARYYWNLGEAFLNNRYPNYRAAAEQYRLCYNEAVQSH